MRGDYMDLNPLDESKYPLLRQHIVDYSAEEILEYIADITKDWGGRRSAERLGQLLDTVRAIALAPKKVPYPIQEELVMCDLASYHGWLYCEWKNVDNIEYISRDRAIRLCSLPNYQYGAHYRFWLEPPTPDQRALYKWKMDNRAVW